MPEVVAFTAPREVVLQPCDPMPMIDGGVRVQTLYSGVSAGTELTAYRGSNAYLTRFWDAQERVFRDGSPSFPYPVVGWGYSEVGRVVEVAEGVTNVSIGDVVHGIWGHRSDAVLPAANVAWRVLPEGTDPQVGTFARVAAVALNGVLAADARLGETVAIFGQGVIGLLATQLAVLSGLTVIAVDADPGRLAQACSYGAAHVVDARDAKGAGLLIRELVPGGVDAAIELSGVAAALHEAIRCVTVEGTVAACGVYQNGAEALRLGDEFHHNRVRIVASQISGVPVQLGHRWDQPRLVRTVMSLALSGKLDVLGLVTDVADASDVGAMFERLDRGDPGILQVLLKFAD